MKPSQRTWIHTTPIKQHNRITHRIILKNGRIRKQRSIRPLYELKIVLTRIMGHEPNE